MKKIVLKIIWFYKRYVSSGYNCRMIPSCSEYTYEAVEKYGVIKGLGLGIRRICKCHPRGKSGIDLVK
jgi:putative membrane protein insertion efficiency factor